MATIFSKTSQATNHVRTTTRHSCQPKINSLNSQLICYNDIRDCYKNAASREDMHHSMYNFIKQ